jgi:hypothetical protein
MELFGAQGSNKKLVNYFITGDHRRFINFKVVMFIFLAYLIVLFTAGV